MSRTLSAALQDVELEPGRTYTCQVNGYWIELRVLPNGAPDDVSSILETDIMMDAWTELPLPPVVGRSRSKLGPPPPLDIPEIPAVDEVS